MLQQLVPRGVAPDVRRRVERNAGAPAALRQAAGDLVGVGRGVGVRRAAHRAHERDVHAPVRPEEARDLARVPAVADGDDGTVDEPALEEAGRRAGDLLALGVGIGAGGGDDHLVEAEAVAHARSRSRCTHGGAEMRISTTPVVAGPVEHPLHLLARQAELAGERRPG